MNQPMTGTPIKIYLVDDHVLVREGIRRLLAGQPDLAVVGEAGEVATAWAQIPSCAPDLVVLDVNLRGASWLELCRRLADEYPAIKVIMLSALADLATVTEALQAGATGYLLKENGPEELLRAIRTVAEHRTYLCAELASAMVEDYLRHLNGKTVPADTIQLTERERLLLKLVAEGKRNKEMAEIMSVQAKSVETFRSRLMKKLGCASSSDLVRYAIREGIIQP